MEFFKELTPLKKQDICVVLDSVSNGFDYPIHNHPEYELNLILGISGTRIVGDSTERFQDADMVLIGPYLPHKWDGDKEMQENGTRYRVITIQFALDLFSTSIFGKEVFHGIKRMLDRSRRGILFDGQTTKKATPLLIKLTKENGFERIILFLQLFNILSNATNFALLSSDLKTSYNKSSATPRIQIAYNYIMMNYKRSDFMISEVAEALNMGISAFSHFFKKKSFRSFSSFLIDMRLGHACKLMLETDYTIAQISVKSGFNNIANFNRLFKKYKDSTPKQYKNRYLENSQFDWNEQRTPWQFIPEHKKANYTLLPDSYSTKIMHI